MKKNPAYVGPLNLPVLPDLNPDPETDGPVVDEQVTAAILEDDTAYSKPPEESVAVPTLPPQSRDTQPTPASITNTT